jgi:hypothetical protein
MTGAPLTHSSPISPIGTVLPSSSTHLTSKDGMAGPQLAGLSTKKSADTAVMIPQVSVMP